MENQEMLNQLRKQTRYAQLQCLFSVIAAVCCVVLLLSVWNVMPALRDVAGQAQSLASQAGELVTVAEDVLTDLQTVSQGLAEADLPAMVKDVDALVSTSQSAVQDAAEKLESIDMKTLNQAIADLADVVEPLAKFFNSIPFGR